MTATSRGEMLAELTRPDSPFELVEREVGGVNTRVYANAPPSLREILESSRAHGDRDFLVYGDERLTFTGHVELVAGLARWLAGNHEIGKGDRIAIGMRNYPEWVVAFWAAQVLGAMAVPLNAWWTGPELRYALDDSGASIALVDAERYARLASGLDELRVPAIALSVSHESDLRGDAVPWSHVRAELDQSAELPAAAIEPTDLATIIYASGTTGQPKGAVSTHGNHVTTFLSTALSGMLDTASAGSARQSLPCTLATYPFFHIGGISIRCMAVGFGMKLVLQYRWDLEDARELVQRERVTMFAAVPTLLRQVVESPNLDRVDLSSLTSLNSGGAPVPPISWSGSTESPARR